MSGVWFLRVHCTYVTVKLVCTCVFGRADQEFKTRLVETEIKQVSMSIKLGSGPLGEVSPTHGVHV